MDHEHGTFNRARTVGGLLLLATGAALLIVDAFSRDYVADTIHLGLLFGTGSVLLGVEGVRRYLGGQD